METNTTFSSSKNSNQIALVTGAAHRLGLVFAKSLANLGYGIVLHYNNSPELIVRKAVEELNHYGVQVFPVRANLRIENEINSLFSFIDSISDHQKNGKMQLKVLVNSAGVMRDDKSENLSWDEYNKISELNLRAPFFCSKLAYDRMDQGGIIINISDIAAQKHWTKYSAYSISKAGLDAQTKILAKIFAPRVRVNGIAPGLFLSSDLITKDEWNRLLNKVPLKITGQSNHLTDTLEFLIKNEYITGQTITVDGGYSLI